MQLSSPIFKDQTFLNKEFTCDGQGLVPPLRVTQYTYDVVSFALTLLDQDSPALPRCLYLIWNIPLPSNDGDLNLNHPNCITGLNYQGLASYHPPSPQMGTHRYLFTLYALDQNLKLSPLNKHPDFIKSTLGHTIQKAYLTALYHRL